MNYCTTTPYGFIWGPVTVERCISDSEKGWVTLQIKSQKEEIQVYVTRTGKVRINSNNGEWINPRKG